MAFIKRKLKFHTATSKQKKLNNSDRFVAAEIEVAGVTNNGILKKVDTIPELVDKWSCNVVFDGSLPLSGFEITTAPANGDLFVKQVNEITDSLKQLGAMITDECGLHIHTDARDFNFQDIAKLIKIYHVIEPVLFAMVPIERRKSRYCHPCGEYYATMVYGENDNYWTTKRNVIVHTYDTLDSQGLRKSKYNDARYNALNLHSWFYRGTIEFRLMPGSIDPDYIVNWGRIWAKILDYALNTTTEALDKELKRLEPEVLLGNIIGDDALIGFMNGLLDKYNPVKKRKSKKRTTKKKGRVLQFAASLESH